MSAGTPGEYSVFHRTGEKGPAIYICTDPSSATKAILSEVAVIYPREARYAQAIADAANISQLPAMLNLVNWITASDVESADANLCVEMLLDFFSEAQRIMEAIKAAREA
jgi:hypothetical protein